mmetsp:Transcript_56104/g.180053  ORF Transcript_56104/g.180053 Transcript_56104/m.180053 type:complete len:223 (-) Transcript_56104:59-727(-)
MAYSCLSTRFRALYTTEKCPLPTTRTSSNSRAKRSTPSCPSLNSGWTAESPERPTGSSRSRAFAGRSGGEPGPLRLRCAGGEGGDMGAWHMDSWRRGPRGVPASLMRPCGVWSASASRSSWESPISELQEIRGVSCRRQQFCAARCPAEGLLTGVSQGASRRRLAMGSEGPGEGPREAAAAASLTSMACAGSAGQPRIGSGGGAWSRRPPHSAEAAFGSTFV